MADYSSILREHVKLQCRSIDRIFLQAYIPNLQTVGLVCKFLRWIRGFKIPSSAAFKKIGDQYVKRIEEYAKDNSIPMRRFEKKENKEEVARPYIEAAARKGEEKVVFIGIAQEKASIWRSWKAKGQEKKSHPHMEWGRQHAFVNHYYFYLWDRQWGGAFWKTNAYAPYPIWIWLNGHEWAKRQMENKQVKYEALDNGFTSCENPTLLQKTCDRLGAGAAKSFFWRWFNRLPSPLTRKDVRRGIVYEMAFRQFEVSDTCVFDRPQAGRMWFEGIIRDHLDIGRPEQIKIFFNKLIPRFKPGKFRTRVIAKGVDPTLTCYYKSSRLKQYFKLGRALRTETVICDTRDFAIGRRVCAANWNALRAVGESANQRLCDAELSSAKPAPDVVTFNRVTKPSTDGGLYAPGLRFGDARTMAVLGSLVTFHHLVAGFNNAGFVAQVSKLIQDNYTSRQATYDLRRLRRKGLINRSGNKRWYEVTELGRRVGVLFTKTYQRVLAPALAEVDPSLSADLTARTTLGRAWRGFDRELELYITKNLMAA